MNEKSTPILGLFILVNAFGYKQKLESKNHI